MTDAPYPKLNVSDSLATLEEQILRKWQSESIFEKSVRGASDYVFYDGPPFANGLPHYGHLLTGFIKDTFARYQTMLGQKVERRFGWDCHGLPAEMGAEKDLGISGKKDIEAFGIDKFNQYCKESVLKYTNQWRHYVTRQGRWVDFKNDYKTMDINYMESVIWAFKQLYNKGLIYESVRVMPYSWACQTPVSDFETRMDNCYREKQSKAITVAFTIDDPIDVLSQELKNLPVHCLIWTTTPWTLPSNLALAVGKDIEYSVIKHSEKLYIIATALASKYKNEIGENIVANISGLDLINKNYKPIFKYFTEIKSAFRILDAEFVTTEDGTGIVHIAPGFGEDDFNLCAKNNIEVVCPVDNGGKFIAPVMDYLGTQVLEANDNIISDLKKAGSWLKTEQYLHNYPHCWRTDTPLIYKAIPSWYVKVTAIRDDMVKNNQKINWIPDHIKNGLFGKWLENARDWSISRNRYWGCPIPVWQSDDPKYPHIEVYGSIEEIEEAFGVQVNDLHKPFIDTLIKKNPSDPTGRSMLRRVPEVLDCWFESGSMPYAQQHYPFENKEIFEKNFPADFIVEYVSQTRGWFYTLMVLSTALFDKPPFLNCICHGVILGDGGQKLSKRLKNYADPDEIFNTIGSDPLRWFMLSSSVMRGGELVIDKNPKPIKEVFRLVIRPILNCYDFFSMYANADSIKASFDLTSKYFMDRYIIFKCIQSCSEIQKALDKYDTQTATQSSERFFEILSNWYIRRSRERFWKSEINQDKIHAYNTLYSVLVLISKAIASLLPFTAEAIFLSLSNKPETEHSVHLERFPELIDFKIDHRLIKNMDKVMEACNVALHLRNELGIRVRQPLSKAIFVGVSEDSLDNDMERLVLDELNLKSWETLPKSEISKYANLKIKLNLPIIGKRIPEKVKELLAAVKNEQWSLANDKVSIAGVELESQEFQIIIETKDEYKKAAATLPNHDGLIILDTNINDELRAEGIIRDIVRVVQQTRKDVKLDITDRIELSIITTNDFIKEAVENWSQYIESQTLSKIKSKLQNIKIMKDFMIDDFNISISISKI